MKINYNKIKPKYSYKEGGKHKIGKPGELNQGSKDMLFSLNPNDTERKHTLDGYHIIKGEKPKQDNTKSTPGYLKKISKSLIKKDNLKQVGENLYIKPQYKKGGTNKSDKIPKLTEKTLAAIIKILEDNKDKNFIQRILNPDTTFFIRENGTPMTHVMAYSSGEKGYYVYPTVVEKEKGKLVRLYDDDNKWEAYDYAIDNNEYLLFDNEEDAAWFSKNYKQYWKAKGVEYYKKGGTNKICDKGIAWAKRTFDTYPSAYANLAASKYCKDPNYAKADKKEKGGALQAWLDEDWVRIDSSGNIAGPCGSSKNTSNPDRCLPRKKAESLTKSERAATARKKKEGNKEGQSTSNTKKAKVTKDYTKRQQGGISYGDIGKEGGTTVLRRGGIIYKDTVNQQDRLNADLPMVEGIADMISQVDDYSNRIEITLDRLNDFRLEGVVYDLDYFLDIANVYKKDLGYYKRDTFPRYAIGGAVQELGKLVGKAVKQNTNDLKSLINKNKQVAQDFLGDLDFVVGKDVFTVEELVSKLPKNKQVPFMKDVNMLIDSGIDMKQAKYMLKSKYKEEFYDLVTLGSNLGDKINSFKFETNKFISPQKYNVKHGADKEFLVDTYTRGFDSDYNYRPSTEVKNPEYSKLLDDNRVKLNELIKENKFATNTPLKRVVNDYQIAPGKKLSELNKGDTFKEKGFTSTTFADNTFHGNVFLRINAPKDKQSFLVPNVHNMSNFRKELEVLLPEGLEFSIKQKRDLGKGRTFFELDIINPYGIAIPATLGGGLAALGVMNMPEDIDRQDTYKKGGINIKPENKGKFTNWCKDQGYNSVTQSCIDKGKKHRTSRIRKMATFADNARKWNK